MLIEKCRGISVPQVIHCDALSEVVGTISDFSMVWFDRGNACMPDGMVATSGQGGDLPGLLQKKDIPTQASGSLCEVVLLDPNADDTVTRLRELAADLPESRDNIKTGDGKTGDGANGAAEPDDGTEMPPPDAGPEPRWKAFECVFQDGTRDVVVVRTTESDDTLRQIITVVWPGLRRLCLDEIRRNQAGLPDEAMLWLVQRKVNASVLVLDENCNLLRTNAAGADLLKRGNLLRVSAGRLCSVNERATAGLHRMVHDVFRASEKDRKAREYVLLLRSRKGGDGQEHKQPLPLTLTPFQGSDGRKVLIALLPMPPEQHRIEHLARKMGLTPSEARVAALIRAGLPSREAARIAGLKIETFNTYAKRALAKMNVSGRADMAQMLTWQAAVERPS